MKITSAWAGHAGLIVVLWGAVACSAEPAAGGSDAGVADSLSPAESARLDARTPAYGASACSQCVRSACATAVTACDQDPACATYLTCVDDCGLSPSGNVDPACAAGCAPPSALSMLEAQLDACRTTGAGSSCAACGAAPADGSAPVAEAGILHESCTPDTDADACKACERTLCCTTVAQCISTPECSAFQSCEVDCLGGVPDDAGMPSGPEPTNEDQNACDEYCYARHPGGLAAWAPAFACTTVLCSDACGGALACPDCTYHHCGDAYANVYGTPDGFLFADCIGLCTSGPSCLDTCTAKYPSVKVALDALVSCVESACPDCNAM